jgi:hypothetical protein
MGGAGQWVGTTYVPVAALYDPDLLEFLLQGEAKALAQGEGRKTIVIEAAFKALRYCEEQKRHR